MSDKMTKAMTPDSKISEEAVKAAFAWAEARSGYSPENHAALEPTAEEIHLYREEFETPDRAVIRILAAHARALQEKLENHLKS